MTFRAAAFALLLCGCAPAPANVTVQTVLPHAQVPIATPEPEEDYGCGVFAKNGVSENARDFRACLERKVSAEGPCDGGSPSLTTLELATALIDDGASGKGDVPRARKLLDGCFRDVSVETVLAHADDKEANPGVLAFETCDEIAQTTLASSECITEHVQNERAWVHRARRSFSDPLRPVFDTATSAASAWQTKLGEIDYARYAGGTMRGPAMQSRILSAMKTRRERLDGIRTWMPGSTDVDRAEARAELTRVKAEILEDAELEVSMALEAEEKAWLTYRDAEAGLYEAMHPGSRSAATIELAAEHTRTLCAMSSEP